MNWINNYKKINFFICYLKNYFIESSLQLIIWTCFLKQFYYLNELIWQDALLIDFLQKKSVNNWIYSFLVNASYLFNERVFFELLIKFILEFLVWPLQRLFFFDFTNVHNLLFTIIFLFAFFFIFTGLGWLLNLLF